MVSAVRHALVRSAKELLLRSGVVSRASRVRDSIRILMYHGVTARGFTPAQFEKQLEYLTRHYDLYWTSEIPHLLESIPLLNRPAVVLTFDDGLRNNVRHVVPLLERYNAKATFFVVSDLLDGKSMLWNHELLCRLTLLDADALRNLGLDVPSDSGAGWQYFKRLVEGMKAYPDVDRKQFLRRIRALDPTPRYSAWMLEEYQIMDSDELKALPSLVEIGSHTRTHPMLDTISGETAEEEIAASRERLEAILGRKVRTFCYPNGRFSEEVTEIVKRTYDVAVTVEQGYVHKGDPLHRLKRVVPGDNVEELMFNLWKPPRIRVA